MGSNETVVNMIPLVDLSMEDLNPGSTSWLSACTRIRQALEEFGFFEVVYNKPSPEFHNTTLSAMEKLFQLPLEIKMKNVSPKIGHGYFGKVLPIHESTGIDHATNRDECLKFTNLMWPQGNQHFCETVHSYAKMAAELLQLLMRMLFESYGVEKYLESHVGSMTYLMRLMKYTRLKGETQTNLGLLLGHTDKTFMTVLQQNHVNALEIRTKGGDWISYQPSSPNSSFFVVAGDLCMAWSNDIIKSCFHRVALDSEEEEVRYSLGLFSFLGGMIRAPEELIDEEHPLKYKPFELQGLLEYLYKPSNAQNNGEAKTIKNYCGL